MWKCQLLSHATPWTINLCDPMDHSPPGSSVQWASPGKNNGVGCHSLLQEIFPIQGLNSGLLHCRQILYHFSHQGSPLKLFRGLLKMDIKYSLFKRYCCCLCFTGKRDRITCQSPGSSEWVFSAPLLQEQGIWPHHCNWKTLSLDDTGNERVWWCVEAVVCLSLFLRSHSNYAF